MVSSNLYFFTGGNDYALSQELSRWKQQFSQKHKRENLLLLRAKETSVSDLLDAVSTMPFVASKRLVILEGVPRMEREGFQSIVENIHPQTVLVIADATENGTVFTPATSKPDLPKWLEDFTLSDLWTMGELGGRR